MSAPLSRCAYRLGPCGPVPLDPEELVQVPVPLPGPRPANAADTERAITNEINAITRIFFTAVSFCLCHL